MPILKQGYTKVVEHIRSELKVYAGIAVAVVGLIAWMQTEFITTAKGKEMMANTQSELAENLANRIAADKALADQVSVLASEVKTSNSLLMLHIDKERFSSIAADIRRNEQEVFGINQFVSVNGENAQATARLRALKSEHEDLILKRDCILNNNKLCD